MIYLCLLLAFLSSSAGALCLLATKRFSEKVMSVLYGSAAGIMMAACFFSLLVPALHSKDPLVILAFIFGIIFIFAIDHLLPHESAMTHEVEGLPAKIPSYTRLILTMAMHNMVQGLALGISFAASDSAAVLMLGVGLILGNLPEGAATALPLLQYFSSSKSAFLTAEALSFLEIPLCFIGCFFSAQLSLLLHPLFGFAAAILLYTVIEEMIPDAWAQHNRALSTLALFAGFSLMMAFYICF